MEPRQSTPKVVVETPRGDITIELFPDPDLAPITVENFLYYVNSGFYDGLIIHRAENQPNFRLIQGGGYRPGGYLRPDGLRPPIINESYNGLKNLRGTIAMARTTDPNSATSQFYINALDHPHLDPNTVTGNPGYCVFGQVISGMNVVDQIITLPYWDKNQANGLETCPKDSNSWEYTYKAQVRVYVALNGNDANGVGGPESPLKTIQKGIDTVNEPGHMVVKPGTYTGTGNRDLDFKGKAITVRNIQPRDAYTVTRTVIDCQGTAGNKHRAFYFHNGEESNSVVQGFTILNGYHDNGGAIYCNNSSPTIKNCTIIDSTAVNYGGGIYCYGGSAWIINCTFSANIANGRGGALCFDHGSAATLMNSILWDNLSGGGHEIALRSASSPSALGVSYSDIEWGQSDINVDGGCAVTWGLGNLDLDPCFVNPATNDYHLQSEAAQWVDTNEWVEGTATSPCIDAGNPGDAPTYEYGSGGVARINMGAEGATFKASVPPAGWQLLSDIDNDGLVNMRDYAYLASFRASTGEHIPGDLEKKYTRGVVGYYDVNEMSDEWLKTASWYWPEKADFNNDKTINFKDFSALALNWLAVGDKLAGDLNEDGRVDRYDVCLLADVWLQKAR